MSKFGFINDIDTSTSKKKFQVYEAVLGFEKISVSVPIENSSLFEDAVANKKPKSGTSIIKLAERFGGGKENNV